MPALQVPGDCAKAGAVLTVANAASASATGTYFFAVKSLVMSHFLLTTIAPYSTPNRVAAFCCTTNQPFGRERRVVTTGMSRLRERCGGVRGCAARHSMNQSGSHYSEPCIGQESESYSENARRRSRLTCVFSLVSFVTFRACARHFRCSLNSGHITALIGYDSGSLCRGYLGWIVISTAASGPRWLRS
jgi:hypothetical protein